MDPRVRPEDDVDKSPEDDVDKSPEDDVNRQHEDALMLLQGIHHARHA